MFHSNVVLGGNLSRFVHFIAYIYIDHIIYTLYLFIYMSLFKFIFIFVWIFIYIYFVDVLIYQWVLATKATLGFPK